MSIVHTEGIVLKTYDYSETSKIAVIFTKDYGKIKVMAKGAKSKKSNTQAVTEPGTYIRLVFYYKSDKELLTLSEATIIDQYPKVRTDLVKFAYYMYVLELIEVLFESDEGGSRDFFTECIAYINTFSESDNPELYVIALEVKMLKAHGHMFECQKCVECGKNVPRDLISSANRTELHPHNTKTEIYLSTVQGGVICKKCKSVHNRGRKYPLTTLQTLLYLSQCSVEEVTAISSRTREIVDIKNILRIRLDFLVGKSLKSLSFLEKTIKM